MESPVVGSMIRVKATFTKEDVPTDPGGIVKFYIKTPDKEVKIWTFDGEEPQDAELQKATSPDGTYFIDYLTTQAGIHEMRAASIGTGEGAADEGRFNVSASQVL